MNDKILALAEHLNIDEDEIEKGNCNSFSDGSDEYLVLTDEEADEDCKEYIREILWAFRTDFILDFLGINTPGLSKSLERTQSELCENANELIAQMIGDKLDDFVNEAISADGRGHFLNHYDHTEYEVQVNGTMYFIYRTN